MQEAAWGFDSFAVPRWTQDGHGSSPGSGMILAEPAHGADRSFTTTGIPPRGAITTLRRTGKTGDGSVGSNE